MTLIISRTEHRKDPQPFPDVHAVQQHLIARGYPVGAEGADGTFGFNSEHGLRRFQTRNGLVVDGRCGKDSWAKLSKSITSPVAPSGTQLSSVVFAELHYRWLCLDGLDGTRPFYVYGAENSLTDKSPDRTDCSESVQWCVYQVTHDSWIDGSKFQYKGCHRISVQQALHTKGALLFKSHTSSPDDIHHVGVSRGDGHRTSEAHSAHTSPQCGLFDTPDQWNFGGLIPILHY